MSVRDRIIDELDLRMAGFSSVRALTKIAEICIDAGRGGEALKIFQRAVDQRRKIYGDGHAKLSECLEGMKKSVPGCSCWPKRRRFSPAPAARAAGSRRRPPTGQGQGRT